MFVLREGLSVPKPKNTARRRLPTWNVYRLKGTPAALVGVVHAPDADSAVKTAIEQYLVPTRFQSRLFAVRAAA